jgi:hypothetical protein
MRIETFACLVLVASACGGTIDAVDSGRPGGRDASSSMPDSTVKNGRDSSTPDSEIENEGSGQCTPMGTKCVVEIYPDGALVKEPPCCGSGRCSAIQCCYSACESTCQPPGGACCESGNPCREDSQCCSGTCLHPDAAPIAFGPGGNCM